MPGKFYGKIGYAESTSEISPGVWDNNIVEYYYYGDVVRNTVNERLSDQILPDLTTGNSFNIIADAYAYEHFFAIRYIEWQGVKWNVTQVEVHRPRLIVRIGGVYNGPTA